MIESIIMAIVGCLCGNAMMFFLLPQERKSKNIDNEAKQSAEWKKLYDDAKEELKEKDTKIDTLYGEITKHRDEKTQIRQEKAELEITNTKQSFLICKVHKCPNRNPPTGY